MSDVGPFEHDGPGRQAMKVRCMNGSRVAANDGIGTQIVRKKNNKVWLVWRPTGPGCELGMGGHRR